MTIIASFWRIGRSLRLRFRGERLSGQFDCTNKPVAGGNSTHTLRLEGFVRLEFVRAALLDASRHSVEEGACASAATALVSGQSRKKAS